jgi:amino acid adenylation domain-containing protein
MTLDNDIKTIRELIDRMAQAVPESTFLISPKTGKAITFHGLQKHSRFLSSELIRAGLTTGDKIAFLLDNGLFAAQLFLGAMYGGFVAVPLNVRAGVSQLSYTLDHCDAEVVYVSEEYSALINEVMGNVSRNVRVILANVDEGPPANEIPTAARESIAPEPEDPALLMYTSGSTGQPKAAVHSHSTILAGARNSIAAHELTSLDRSLLVLPLYHINAECVTLIPTLMSGGSVVVPHRFSVSQFWDWLDEYECTWSAIVPTIVSQLLDWRDPKAKSRGAAFQRIRFLRSSSAPLAPSLHREFLDKFPLLLIQAMGSSEAGNVFSNPLPPRENKIGSPGVPWGFEVKIVNRDGVEVAPGESGEMLMRGAALTSGYYKQPEESAAVFDAEGWLHTGDLAYRDEDGYFFVVGRSKELIIKGGVNIAPRQIDDVLESHPAVLEAAAVGVPDHYMGEDLVAFVVLRAGVARDETELLKFCEGRLGHFKTPTRIYFASDLPKGPSGKVQRLRLRDEATQFVIEDTSPSLKTAHGHGVFNGLEPLSSSMEAVISESWAEILCLPHVDPGSNFFALGGHSLLAVQCVSLLRERIPVALSLSDFFEHATVAQQAELVRGRLENGTRANGQRSTDQSVQHVDAALHDVSSSVSPSKIPLRDGSVPCPLSPAQRRLWFMEQLNPGLPVYNESEAVRLIGDLDIDAMGRALNVIVQRHEILRTTIRTVDTEPTAIVHESWPLQLKQIDISTLSAAERQAEVEHLLTEEPRRPYSLEAEPGIRATLLRLGPQEHVLILMMHHIICDWSSEGVLWRELSDLYRMFSRGETPALPPLAIQHGDYASWQVKQNIEANFAEDLAFWEQTLRGSPELLELPSDRTRPSTLSHRGARQRIVLKSTLTAALRDLGRRAETTLFSVFAAALNTLLYRYTGQEDILLGIPIADRDRKELQQLIGFLLHTQVLRTGLSGDMTFRGLLAQVQKAALDLYLHRAVPFDQVVRKMQPERNLSYSPLFQVMLNWRDRDQLLSFIGLEGLVIESLLAESRTSKFDLTLFATDCGNEIWLEMEYSTDLFDDARITRMLGHFQTLLESVAGNPDSRLADLPILTPAERQSILVDWNRTELAYPKDRLVHELIEEQVERTPDAVAVVFESQQLTYRQLNERANHVASHLHNLGVGPNVLVGICVDRSLEMLIGLLGILKAGGAYVPLDPTFPIDRLSFMLEDSQPLVLLTLKTIQAKLSAHRGKIVWLDAILAETKSVDATPKSNQCKVTDLAYVLYTSGSTGKPKGVQISNRALVNFLSSMRKEPGLLPHDTLLAVTTPSFDIAGLELFLPLIIGARVVIASREATVDGAQLSTLMKHHGVTVMQATPATWRLLLEAGWTGSQALTILCGGEAWPATLADELLPRCKSLWNMYGPTETTIWSSVMRVESGKPILIGAPIGNTTFYVFNNNRCLVPVGVPGELYIGGDSVAQGYHNRLDLTQERFVSHPFSDEPNARLYKTGDVVRRLSDGMIEFLHRNDQQVKLRGFRIELGDIEAALKQHPGVAQCVVVTRQNSEGNQRLEAYVVPSQAQSVLTTSDLRDFVKQKLPEYMVPSAFAILDRFPLTPNGKTDRKALSTAQYLSSNQELGQSSIAPQTVLEFHLHRVWERVLDMGAIGVNDNFFDIGGHSLLAVRLLSEMNKELSISLTLPIFFLNPTIGELARILQDGKFAKPHPHLVPLRKSDAQGTLFFLDASMAVCSLAQLLDVGMSIFSTHVPLPSAACQPTSLNNTNSRSSTSRLEELAAVHVALIRQHNGSGPCFLAGHSFCGLLAFEVAHQLRASGVPVKMLLLLDTMLLPATLWYRLKVLSRNRLQIALRRRLHQYLFSGVVRARVWMVNPWRPISAAASNVAHADELYVELPLQDKSVFDHLRKDYKLRPLEIPTVLFFAQDGDKRYTRWGHALANLKKLSRLFGGGLKLVDLPGDHVTILQDPHVLVAAQKLGQALATCWSSKDVSAVCALAPVSSGRTDVNVSTQHGLILNPPTTAEREKETAY